MPAYWPTVTLTFQESPADEALDLLNAYLGMIDGFEGSIETRAEALDPQSALLTLDVYFPLTEAPEETTVVERASAMVDSVQEAVAQAGAISAPIVATLEPRAVENRDWGYGWRDYFHITKVGERLYCAPPWEAELPADADPDAKVIVIEPGQAFGTGTHETSKLCMGMLESYTPKDGAVYDIGAGSGILSIGAVLLGAIEALCLEIDPVAEENFHLNAKLNKVEGKVHFLLGSSPTETVTEEQRDAIRLILCNMLSKEFLPLLGELRSFGQPMVLSGFLLTEEDRVNEELTANGWKVAERREMNEWGAAYVVPC